MQKNQELKEKDWSLKVCRDHSEMCKGFFNEIKEGKEIYIYIEKKGVNTNETQNAYNRASIVTNSMLEYDLRYLTERGGSEEARERLLKSYRPYFVDFLIAMTQDIEQLEEKWYTASFWNDDNGRSPSNNGEYIVYEGILEYSASPVQYEKRRLLIFKNGSIPSSILNKINSICRSTAFSNTPDLQIQDILQDLWAGERVKTIDCYNLGKGNSDYIRGHKERILYDIGYSYREFPKKSGKYNYNRACQAIRHAQPSCVILSHWDMDHIVGFAYAKQRIFDIPWIAPCLDGNGKPYSINAYRLARYLECLSNLFLVDRSRGRMQIAQISNGEKEFMRLYLGGGRDGSITPVNSEGLYLEFYSRDTHIVLAGDVPYKCMMSKIWDSGINYLHVPHHCSNMDYSYLDNLDKYPNCGKVAIISTNRNKNTRVKNFHAYHKNALDSKFSDVICTIDNISNDDNQNLSYQINLVKNTSGFR